MLFVAGSGSEEFKCPSFVDSYFYFPGRIIPVWHGQRVTEVSRWRMLKEEGAAAPIPAQILILGTDMFSCEEAAYRETEGQTTVHTVLQKSHIPHVSLICSDTTSIPMDLVFLWGLFVFVNWHHPKCKYRMLPPMQSTSVLSRIVDQTNVLFYSILFYSILFYSCVVIKTNKTNKQTNKLVDHPYSKCTCLIMYFLFFL